MMVHQIVIAAMAAALASRGAPSWLGHSCFDAYPDFSLEGQAKADES